MHVCDYKMQRFFNNKATGDVYDSLDNKLRYQ